jgi:hypothetical protein
VKVPFFLCPIRDQAWVVPFVVFWQVVLQEGLLPRDSFILEVEEYFPRDATEAELSHMQQLLYLPPSSTREGMVPIADLASCLGQINLRMHKLDATIKSLLDINASSVNGVVSYGGVQGGFAQIEECMVEHVGGGYGLRAVFPEYYEKGTELDKQLVACQAFFFNPPLGSGLRGPMAPETLAIKIDAAQEFWGYCKKHEGREPSFELLRDTTMVARFLSFRKARQNVVNTLLICILDLRALLPFVFFDGACPGLSALPQPEVDSVKAWYKEVTARIGVEAQKPGSKRRAPPEVPLAALWEALENKWLSFKASFEVGECMAAWHWMLALESSMAGQKPWGT